MCNCVIDYQGCNRLPVREFFKNILKSHTSLKVFEKPSRDYKYVTCQRKRVFQDLIVLFSHKQIICQTLENQLSILIRFSTVLSFLNEKINICTFLKKNYCDLLNCKNPEHRGEGFLSSSEVPKEFYKDSENLKWII